MGATAMLMPDVSDQLAEDELQSIYRVLTRHFHPEWRAIQGTPTAHGGASLFRLWEAFDALRQPFVLPTLRSAETGQTEADGEVAVRSLDDFRPPTDDECMFCGSTPTRHTLLRHHDGRFVDRQTVPVEGSMCRSCGIAMAHRKQKRTLRSGWWGARSFVINGWVVMANQTEISALRSMPTEIERADEVIALLDRPMGRWATIQNPRGLVS